MTRRFMLLMGDDTTRPENAEDWEPYLARLRSTGAFEGGSSLGPSHPHRRIPPPEILTGRIVGYLIVRAHDPDSARSFLPGNPVYEAGGTVEIRELVED